jgi:hypothetical protein
MVIVRPDGLGGTVVIMSLIVCNDYTVCQTGGELAQSQLPGSIGIFAVGTACLHKAA